MDIETLKKLIKRYEIRYNRYLELGREGRRYYRNKPDIIFEPEKDRNEQPLRNADNKIPFNFHGLLVNQKAAYMFTVPPAFDVGGADANDALSDLLGEEFGRYCKDLCVDASNTSVAWLHVWRGEDKGIRYAPVPSDQVIPIWDKALIKRLLGVLRVYPDIDEETGNELTVYEYWNDSECSMYVYDNGEGIDFLREYNKFADNRGTPTNIFAHDIGEVPFFCFENNNIGKSDLYPIKMLIDAYCKVFSGFMNDLEDIQEIIFILTNYGGQNLSEFLQDMKQYKVIKIENEGAGDKSGVNTLTIDLPTEAREKFLDITRACIFEQGMGIDPEPQNFGNSSGVALKYLYALLEQKAGLMETQFRSTFSKFVRCICACSGIPVDTKIIQTWRRTSVTNDTETAQIAQQSNGIISRRTILANHPWVEDVDTELEQLEEDRREVNPYEGMMFNDQSGVLGTAQDRNAGSDDPGRLEDKKAY